MPTLDRDAKIVRDDYLVYIRTKPCCACGKQPVEAHHLKARTWRDAKRNDLIAIALCRQHHQEVERKGRTDFETAHRVNLWEEAFYSLLEFYLAERLTEEIDSAKEMRIKFGKRRMERQWKK